MVRIDPCITINLMTNEKTSVVIVADDYASSIIVCDSSSEDLRDMSSEELIELVVHYSEVNDNIKDMLNYLVEVERGLQVGNTWFEWDEIKNLLEVV